MGSVLGPETMILLKFKLLQLDPELDTVALKEAVKAGREMPDCIVVTEHPGTRYLRTR